MSTLLQAGDGNVAAEALGVAVAARVPVLLWGAPGTGKTSAIRAMADAMGLPCETVIASIREPSDFAGLPVVTGDVGPLRAAAVGHQARRGRHRCAVPRRAVHRAARGTGRAAAGGAGTDRRRPDAARRRGRRRRREPARAGRGRLGPVRAAGQPAVPPELGDVAARRSPRGWPAAGRRRRVPLLPDGWTAAEQLNKSLVAAFLQVRPALAIAPPNNAAEAGRGWPSPRTWEMAARLMTAAEAAKATDQAQVGAHQGSGRGRRGRGVPRLAGGDGPARS